MICEGDLVNLGLARARNLPTLAVSGIDRGGVLAAFHSTVALLDAADQALICSFLVNKFRGDQSLLDPGLRMIEDEVESRAGTVDGLGLLPVRTRFARAKTLARPIGRGLGAPVRTAYEIHHGTVTVEVGESLFCADDDDNAARVAQYDRLADAIEEHVDTAAIRRLLDRGPTPGLALLPPGAPG